MRKSNESSPYYISFDTFLIQPIVSENKIGSLIIERNQELTSARKPFHLVSRSCFYYGNSFKNTTNNSKLLLSKSHKLPVVIVQDFGNPLVLLPTMSPFSEHNVWIALHAIENIYATDMGCIVHLTNQHKIKLDVSEATIHRQCALGHILIKKYQDKFRELHGILPPNTIKLD